MMNEAEPSIVIFIDPETKNVKINFRPQTLSPAQYGVVVASVVAHMARLFMESNPEHDEDDIVAEIQKGIDAGLSQREDMLLAQKPH